jgi:hypothetical protein
MNWRRSASGIFARLRSWLRAVWHRRRLEGEMEEELANHLDELTAEMVRVGEYL